MRLMVPALILVIVTRRADATEEIVSALSGSDAVLPCKVPRTGRTATFSLYWFHQPQSLKHVPIYSYHHHGWGLAPEVESLHNRMEMFPDLIQKGDASLTLLHVGVADQGRYICLCLVKNKSVAMNELVVEVSAPYGFPQMQTIVLGSSVLLRCHARGGYPTALVQWHDGKQGTFQAMNTIQSPDGEELLEVRSYLVLDVKRDQNVCCSFTNYRLHHTDTSCTTLRARWEDSYRVSGHLLLGTALVLACLWVARRMKIWRL